MDTLITYMTEQLLISENHINSLNQINKLILTPYERGLIDGRKIAHEAHADYLRDAIKMLSI